MTMSAKAVGRVLLALAISGGLSWFMLRKYPLEGLSGLFAGLEWRFVALGVGLRMVVALLQGVRWKTLFPTYPLWLAVESGLVSAGANLLIPVRGGEAVRALFLRHMNAGNFIENFAAAVVERALDASVLVVFAVVGAMLLGLDIGDDSAFRLGAIAVVCGGVVVGGFMLTRPRVMARIERMVGAPGSGWRGRFVALARQAMAQVMCVRPARLLAAVAVTAAITPLCGVMLWCYFQAVHLPVAPAQAVLFFPLVALSISLPASIGYVGVFHGALLVLLAWAGFDTDRVLGAVVVTHVLMFLPVLVYTVCILPVRLGLVRMGREAPHA